MRTAEDIPVSPEYSNDQERCDALIKTIKMVKPDIIHSMEIQHAGYLTLDAKKIVGNDFPIWVVTNWGSDIYHFGQFPEHAKKVREMLEACDYYGCECQRDVEPGPAFGFRGEVLPVMPIMGGSDLEFMKRFRQPGPTSRRTLVVLKGYQGWVYRALVGLQAIELCADIFREKGYRLAIYLASDRVREAATELPEKKGVKSYPLLMTLMTIQTGKSRIRHNNYFLVIGNKEPIPWLVDVISQ